MLSTSRRQFGLHSRNAIGRLPAHALAVLKVSDVVAVAVHDEAWVDALIRAGDIEVVGAVVSAAAGVPGGNGPFVALRDRGGGGRLWQGGGEGGCH